MSRIYFDRYQFFVGDGNFRIVPGIELPIKGTDRYHTFKSGKDRLDKLSQEFYNTPTFGWLIMTANQNAGTNEFEIQEGLAEDLIEFYYKTLRKKLSNLTDLRINVDGLGHFVIKKGSVSRLIKKYENYMNKYDSQTFTNYHNKKYAESKLEKLKHVKTVIDSSIEEKRTFRNAEKDKKHLG